MDANSIEEIEQDGSHLEAIRQILLAAGMTLLRIAPEVAVHCSEEQADAMATIASDVLGPIIENVGCQIDVLMEKHKAALAEVEGLEALLQD